MNAAAIPFPVQWKKGLIKSTTGKACAIFANALTALRHAPEWRGVIAYNEFSLGVVGREQAPWEGHKFGSEWSDHEDRLTANWLQHQGIHVSLEVAAQAVQTVSRDNPFHPVRDYLDELTWDGTQRLDLWPATYLGVQTQGNDRLQRYITAVGSRFLIQAVARIYRPGVKADCTPILEGTQGIGKSTTFRILGGEWFTDEIADLGSKDAAMQTRGVWIIEISELDSMNKGDVGTVKSFMTRTTDRFRPPYGKRVIESPRQCVFAGSVNLSTYLKDETGNRRFWPLACTKIDNQRLAMDRDQLWAEAKVRYDLGEVWWMDSAELNDIASEEQAVRYDGDPWDDLIAKWVESPHMNQSLPGYLSIPFSSTSDSVCVPDILVHCLGKRMDTWTQADKNRAGRSLRSLGWVYRQVRNGAGRERRFQRVSQ